MRAIFEASYRSFYYLIIGILWGVAIVFATLQSGLVIEFAAKNILPKYGVTIQSASGGLLSGIELRGVKYDKLLSASEIRFRFDPLSFANEQLKLSYLDIKELRLDEKELEKLLKNKTKSEKPEFFKSIVIEQLSLTMGEIGYKDIKAISTKINSDYLYYDFEKIYANLDSELKTNILDVKIHGEVLDGNYSFRGSLKPNGSKYINNLVGDVDFDFNALSETDFLIRGDDEKLYAKAHFVNTGKIYKYTVDAKINDVLSEMNMNLKDMSFRIDSKGELACRYGVVDSDFSVVYDGNKTVYFGKGRAKKFTYIPLGVFEKSIKIKEAINKDISFSGDVHKVEVKASNIIKATLLGEKFDVDSSQTIVNYDIDKELLGVRTKARLNTAYLKGDVDNFVEDGKDGLKYHGTLSNLADISLRIDNEAFKNAIASYSGDDNKISVNVKTDDANINVNSHGYSRYDFDASLAGIKPIIGGKIDALITANVNGKYEYSKDEISATARLSGSKIFGQNIEAKEISFTKTPKSLIVPKTTIKIGGVEATLEAATNSGVLRARASTAGVIIKADGQIDKELVISMHGDSAVIAEEYAKITGTKRQNITGKFDILSSITNEQQGRHFSVIGSSNLMKIGDEFFENIRVAANGSQNQVVIQNLAAAFQGKTYRLDNPTVIDIKDGKAVSSEIKINNTLLGSFEYNNKRLNAKAKITNFAYRDSNKISFLLDADVAADYADSKLNVNADARLKDLRVAFELKSSNITKDKDIVILKPKKVEFDEKKFDENIALRINITTTNKAIYRSKEAYAPISVNMLYYKDFGEKPMMLGLVKTEGGHYDMEGKRFLLQPGSIALTPAEPNNPYLNLTLKHIDKDTQISIFVKGFASSPKLSFSSNPSMSEKEIISYLLFGVDPDSGFSRDSNDAKYSSKAIGALSNALSRDLTKEFGIKLDKVEISPTEVTDKTGRTTQATKVEVGKRVTKDLTVTYKNDIESSVVFEYQINKNVSVESQAGRKSSIDIFYKQDY